MVNEYKGPRSKYYFYIGGTVFAFIVLIPLYILVIIAFGVPSQTIGAYYPMLLPTKFTLANLHNAFTGYGLVLLAAFYKSLETAFIVASLAVLLGFHAAYGLNKIPYKYSNMILALLFFSTMIPSLTIAIPISTTFIKIGLYDSALGLALAQELVVLPLTVFLITGAFEAIPRTLEYQARVDGATFSQALYKVIFPLALPGIVSAFLLSWLMSWDEFTFAVILSPVHPTLPILIYLESTARGDILTGTVFSLLVTIPVIALTVILSKFIRGSYLSAGITG